MSVIEKHPESSGDLAPDRLAQGAQFAGDFLADSRPVFGHAIASQILGSRDYRSSALSLYTAIVGAGDAFDGRAARFAAARNGTQTTPEGARKDELKDKEWTRIMLGAYASRALMDKRWGRALFVMASKTVIEARDGAITKLRNEAQELGADVKAGPWGKRKTGLQNAIFAYENIPHSKTKHGRKVSFIGQAAATGLSIYSGFKTARKLKKNIAEARAAQDSA